MKRSYAKVIFAFVFLCGSLAATAQDFGLSFSYFLPKNGYFSTPISPFSIRGLGVDLNRFVALETGFSLYRMSGLNVKDLPFESRSPLIGPNFTILVPAEVVFQLKANRVEFDIKGGGFFFHTFGNKINYGNFDRALRAYNTWDVANADVSFSAKPGFGYHGGAELTLYVTSDVGVSLETNYFVGDAKFPVKGTVTGGSSTIETQPLDYAEAKIDFTGLEFSIGLIFSSGGGGKAPKKSYKRRRR
ncbi:MAG TPA: hypothetical protein VGD65_26175 [Chryseosolibacter sp.]